MVQKVNILTDLETPGAAFRFYNNYLAYDSWRQADKIIERYGKGTVTYYDDIMDTDAVISGVLESRIAQVTGLGWSIVPASEEEYDIEVANFVTDLLTNLDNFPEYLTNIMSSLRSGFSVQGVNWRTDDKHRYIPSELISCDPDYFRFGANKELRMISDDNWEGVAVDDYRFLVMNFQPRYSNPYGVSLLRPLYWPWWFKHHGYKWWLQASERGAVVTPVGKYKRGASDDEIAKLVAAVKNFISNKFIVTLDENDIEFPHITVDPELTRLLIDNIDAAIRYRIEGSTLASGTATSGNRALGEVHQSKAQVRIEADAKALQVVVNRLIKWIVELNFPVSQLPKFRLDYEAAEDTKPIRENIKMLVEHGARISMVKAVELLNLPLASEDEEILVLPTQANALTSPFGFGGGSEGEEDKENKESELEENEIDEDEELETEELIKKKILPITELDEILKEWTP